MDGHTLKEEECYKQVVIKAGNSAGAVLKYKGEGNEQFKSDTTDLIVTLAEDKQDLPDACEAVRSTKRKGHDLIYTCTVKLQ